jgi:5-methylcytosine-specific restriction endonuclease McrA
MGARVRGSNFTFENTKPVITDRELLDDLSGVAAQLGAISLPQRLYRLHGRYSATAIKNRFGSWNAAVRAAGLTSSADRHIQEIQLFDNLQKVWIALGRQPRKRDMARPVSTYTHHPYVERYGGWLDAVKAFLASSEREETLAVERPRTVPTRGPRDPSLRLRFLVMRRDAFRCRQCGSSPAVTPGVELHVDHVIAWVNGGATTMENLQTLCSRCNLGKADLSHERTPCKPW